MIERIYTGGIRTRHFEFEPGAAGAAGGAGLLAAVTTRHGGCSTGPYAGLNLALHVGDDPVAVQRNRDLLRAALGLDHLAVADQRHGREVAVARPGKPPPAADVLLTDEPGVAVSMMVADCAPIVLYDPVRRAVAVVHAGRRGAVLDAPGAAVAALAGTYGSRAADLLAGIGPCIGKASYEIGGEALAEAGTEAAFVDGGLLEPTRPGHARFDLPGAVVRRLVDAGVPPHRIERSCVDTFTATADFFSDRAQRPCGRFMLVAALSGA